MNWVKLYQSLYFVSAETLRQKTRVQGKHVQAILALWCVRWKGTVLLWRKTEKSSVWWVSNNVMLFDLFSVPLREFGIEDEMFFLLTLNEGHEVYDRVTIFVYGQSIDVLLANCEVLVSVFGQHGHDFLLEVFLVDILVLGLIFLWSHGHQ